MENEITLRGLPIIQGGRSWPAFKSGSRGSDAKPGQSTQPDGTSKDRKDPWSLQSPRHVSKEQEIDEGKGPYASQGGDIDDVSVEVDARRQAWLDANRG